MSKANGDRMMMYGGCCDYSPNHGYTPFDKDGQGCYDFATYTDGTPKIRCKTTKECVKTYKTCYKMYRISTYRLYKCCSRCGAEFDYYVHRGLCPRCH